MTKNNQKANKTAKATPTKQPCKGRMRPVSIFRRKRPLKINHASSIAASFFTLLHLQSCCAPGCSLTLLLPTAPSERHLGRTIPLCSESTCFPLQAVTSLIHPSEIVIFSSLLLALSHCDFLPPQATREATSLPAALHHWCGFSVIWFSIPASSLLLNINYAPLKPLVSLPVQHNFNTFLFLRGFFPLFHYILLSSHSPLPIIFFPPMLLPSGTSLHIALMFLFPSPQFPLHSACCWLPFHISF